MQSTCTVSACCFRDTLSKEAAEQVPGWIQDILYLTAVLNSCLNPLVYGHYYLSEKRRRHEDNKASRPRRLKLRGGAAKTHLNKCSCACRPSSVRSSTTTHPKSNLLLILIFLFYRLTNNIPLSRMNTPM